MTITVRLYAQLRETTRLGGQTRLEIEPETTVLQVADRLGIGEQPLEIMVNDARAHNGIKVADGDVVSYFPALAGG